jgi:Rha family phage regulatory protein
VAEVFGKQHKHVIRDIEKMIVDLPEKDRSKFGQISTEDSYGRKRPAYQMNRDGFSLLAMGFTGKKALHFKLKYIDAFNRMEQALLNQFNLSWQEQRTNGKITRKVETDIIARFVDYATEQGSASAKMYYMNITKMTHKALFLVCEASPKPFRDMLDTLQLNALMMAEDIVSEALEEGMGSALHYKDIYSLARDRVNQYAATLTRRARLAA